MHSEADGDRVAGVSINMLDALKFLVEHRMSFLCMPDNPGVLYVFVPVHGTKLPWMSSDL